MKLPLIFAALLLPITVLAQMPNKPAPKPATPSNQYELDYSKITLQEQNTPFVLQYIPQSPTPDFRVDLNCKNVSVKEALKQIMAATKSKVALESDVPESTRVTAVGKNLRLETALAIIADETGQNWTSETPLHWLQQSGKSSDGKNPLFVFRLGKTQRTLFLMNPGFYQTLPSGQTERYYWNAQHTLHFNESNASPSYNLSTAKIIAPTQKTEPLTLPSQQPGLQTPGEDWKEGFPPQGRYNPGSGNQPGITYTPLSLSGVKVAEERSTFTCPHCKQQVTVLHQHTAPKCEKCSRTFHDDWQFCPFDGAKRPASAGTDWQFCPLCGKSVKAPEKIINSPLGKTY